MPEVIRHILEQEFTNWELIIVDDGSVDNTADIVKSFQDERIRYFYIENSERGAARHFGAEQAKGKFLNFFDSDDWMLSFHLQRAYDEIMANEKIEVLTFPWLYCHADGKENGDRRSFQGDLNEIVCQKNFIHLNGSFISAKVYFENPFIPDRKFIICEDWFFFLKLSLTHKIYYKNEPTFKYILHDGSTMANMKSESFEVAIGYFEELIENNNSKLQKYRKAIIFEMYSMLSLASSLEGNKKKAIRYLRKTFMIKPFSIFSKRSMATVKHILYAKRRS